MLSRLQRSLSLRLPPIFLPSLSQTAIGNIQKDTLHVLSPGRVTKTCRRLNQLTAFTPPESRCEVGQHAWVYSLTLPNWASTHRNGDLQYQRTGPRFCSTSEGVWAVWLLVGRICEMSGPDGWGAWEVRSYLRTAVSSTHLFSASIKLCCPQHVLDCEFIYLA